MDNTAVSYDTRKFLSFNKSIYNTATCHFNDLLGFARNVKQLKDCRFSCHFSLNCSGQHINDAGANIINETIDDISRKDRNLVLSCQGQN